MKMFNRYNEDRIMNYIIVILICFVIFINLGIYIQKSRSDRIIEKMQDKIHCLENHLNKRY